MLLKLFNNDDVFDSLAKDFFSKNDFIPRFNSLSNFSYKNISEKSDDKQLSVTFMVPGLSKNDLSLELINSLLIIKNKKDDKELYNYQLYEYSDIEKIDAKCENGLLKIIIPHKKETKNTKIIEIK